MPGYSNHKPHVKRRLQRIEGQVRGLRKMVDDDRYCIDVLTQVSAVKAALESVALLLLADHMEHCVAEAIRAGDGEAKVKELNGAVQRLVKAKQKVFVLTEIGQALQMAFFMFWEVLWPLTAGFVISAIVQSVVSKQAIVHFLGKDDLRGVTFATLFGAASSSCSYAAVAIARGLFRRGASFANAILFEFASTNLVFELGIVLLVLLGWEFVAAELAGGLLMIGILAVVFKYTLRARMVDKAREQAEKGLRGRMEGHGDMDMSVTGGPFFSRLFSGRAFTAVSE